jgi:glutamate-1-semialdehyde 2,1-aminomutase
MGEPGARAAALGRQLVDDVNGLLRQRGLRGWAAYGDGSIFHVIVGSSVDFAPGELAPDTPVAELKSGGDAELLRLLRLGLNNHGVDLMRGRSGFLSVAHTEDDIVATVAALAATLDEIAGEP